MDPVRGPRVLVDATAVPPDRGGVGRYVDEWITKIEDVTSLVGGPFFFYLLRR